MIRKFLSDIEYIGWEGKFWRYLGASAILAGLIGLVNIMLTPIPIIITLGVPVYLAEKKRMAIKRAIPEIAMSVSELWGVIPISNILERQENEEMKKTGKAIERGVPVVKALRDLERKVPELGPITSILISSYRGGYDASKLLYRLANQYSGEIIIQEETKANQLIESITIASSATVMVPFVIGSMVSMSRSLGASLLGNSVPVSIQRMAILGSSVYIGIFAIMAGLYLGITSNSIRKSVLYSGVILPIAIIVLKLSMSISF